MSAERTLTDFVRALRSADVAVSTAETIDAAGALKLIGYDNRTRLKHALRPVLAKSEVDKETYDRLFDLYFIRERLADTSPAVDANLPRDPIASSPSDTPMAFEALATSGDETAIAMALERAGQDAGVQDIRFSTQTAYYAQKMMKALGVERLEQRLLDALSRHTPESELETDQLMAARREMTQRARTYVARQFDVFGAGATEQFRDDIVAERRINALDRRDLDRMAGLVAKIAKRLAVKHSRRRRKKHKGQLDVRRTLRANAGRDGVPFDIFWRQKRRERPKIIVLCDVSGSVAQYVRFLLLLLHSLNDVVPDLRAFAFSARLRDVGNWLETDGFEHVMDRIVREVGMGSTDYGQALSDLKVDHWNMLDRRTSLIILGDGRSNYGDPRIDIFKEAAARTKRIIWLNPEGEGLWGTGDSVIPRYRPYCASMAHVATLKDLERAVDDVLAQYV